MTLPLFVVGRHSEESGCVSDLTHVFVFGVGRTFCGERETHFGEIKASSVEDKITCNICNERVELLTHPRMVIVMDTE